MAADVSIRVGIDGEKEFKSAVNGINSQIKNLNSEMKSVVSGFTSLEDAENGASQRMDILSRSVSATKQKLSTLTGELDRQKAKLNELGQAADEAGHKEYSSQAEKAVAIAKANNAYNRQVKVVSDLSAKVNNTTADLNRLEKELKDVADGSDKVSKSFKDAGDAGGEMGGKLKGVLVGGAIAGAIGGIVSGLKELIGVSLELGKNFSRLETNTKRVGISMKSTNSNFQEFFALTGDADSSIEALSNLLNTGFNEKGLASAVDALGGAVIRFPDTLNIESLADGLQETLATGAATGQFGELLDRLGIGAENFSNQLAGCTTEAEKQELVLNTLAKSGLNETYEEYVKNNKAMLEYQKSSIALQQSLAKIGAAVMPIFTAVNKAVTILANGVLAVFSAFQSGGFDGVLELIKNFSSRILENLPAIVEAGGQILQALITGLIQAIPFLVQAMPAILSALVGALGALAAALLEQGLELGKQLISGIGSALGTAGEYISQAFSVVVQSLGAAWETIKSIFSGVGEFFGGVFSSAASLIQSVWSGITGFFSNIWGGIQAVFSSVSTFFSGLFGSAATAIRSAWSGITGFFSGIWSQIKGVFSDALSKFLSVGQNIVDGIKQGFSNAWGAFKDWVLGKLNDMVDAVLSFFGIHSPSRLFAWIGENLIKGLGVGIKKSKDASNAMKEQQDDIVNLTYQTTEKIKSILDEYEKTLENKLKNEKLSKVTKESLEKQIESVKGLKDEYLKAVSEIEKSQENMANKLKNYGKLFTEIKTETGSFLQLNDLQKDIDAINQYGNALEQLKNRGISDSLMNEITGMNVNDALAYTDQLLGMTEEQYANYMSLWEEKQKAADEVARKFYQDEMDALTEEFVDKIPEELSGVKDEMRTIGVQGVQGMIDGLYSQSGALSAAARRIVAQAIAAMRMEADIHSPSKATNRLIGQPMAEGVAVGFLDMMRQTSEAIGSAAMLPVKRVTTADLYGASAGMVNGVAAVMPSGGNSQTVIIPVNLNGKQIAEVVYDPLKQVKKQRGY